MNIQQFTQELSKALHQIKERPINQTDFFAYREQQLMLGELAQLILFYQDDIREADEINVRPFCQFLAKRFHLIQNTRLTYFINRSAENEKCWALAKLLSPIVKAHFLTVLIPTLNMKAKELPDVDFHDAKARDFFVNESGNALIRRSKVLFYAETQRGGDGCPFLGSTYELNGKKRELTETEKNLVLYYNKQAINYYEKIKSGRSFLREKHAYADTLLGARAPVAVLKEFGHGEQGENTLKSRLIEQSQTFLELIEFMANYMKKSEWQSALKNMDMAMFSKLILNDEKLFLDEVSFASFLNKLNLLTNSDLINRAAGFCILQVYWKGLREPQGDFKSFMAHIFGRWVAYSKDDKKEAVIAGREFLVSDAPLTEQGLDEFLKDQGKSSVKGALMEAGSMLGFIFRQILNGGYHPAMGAQKAGFSSSLFNLWPAKKQAVEAGSLAAPAVYTNAK